MTWTDKTKTEHFDRIFFSLTGMQFLYTTVFGAFTAFIFMRTGKICDLYDNSPTVINPFHLKSLFCFFKGMLSVQFCAIHFATVRACLTSALPCNTLTVQLCSSHIWWEACCFWCCSSRWQTSTFMVPFPSFFLVFFLTKLKIYACIYVYAWVGQHESRMIRAV